MTTPGCLSQRDVNSSARGETKRASRLVWHVVNTGCASKRDTEDESSIRDDQLVIGESQLATARSFDLHVRMLPDPAIRSVNPLNAHTFDSLPSATHQTQVPTAEPPPKEEVMRIERPHRHLEWRLPSPTEIPLAGYACKGCQFSWGQERLACSRSNRSARASNPRRWYGSLTLDRLLDVGYRGGWPRGRTLGRC